MLRRVLGSSGLAVNRLQARLAPVLAFLESDGTPGLHVVSHGFFDLADADLSALWLEKAHPPDETTREKLYPKLVNGRCLGFGQASPTVFFNACTTGRSGFTYWGKGGWARVMVAQAGSSAFLAPFWEVEDTRALKFAEAFYDELLKGQTIGEAVRVARTATKGSDNPTWLAYCLYAHPAARLAAS